MKNGKNGKEKKTERVVDPNPPAKRAKGTKLPAGNCLLVAKADVSIAKMPANLVALFEKIAAKGKDGARVKVLAPATSSGRYTRWLIRQLVAREAVRAIPEEKPEPKKSVTKKVLAKKAPAPKKVVKKPVAAATVTPQTSQA
jgi:hypothetical protein